MAKSGFVRGVGFANRSDVQDVIHWLDSQTHEPTDETIAIARSCGRVSSEAMVSEINVPAFRRAMMDGYAVVAASIQGANGYNQIRLEVIDRSLPGRPAAVPWPVDNKYAAIEIMTGAPFPPGPDAVLPFEKTEVVDNEIFAIDHIAAKKNIGEIGEDIQAGDVVLARNHLMRPQDIGVAASVGKQDIKVWRRPTVRVLITGNEIVRAGQSRTEHQIFDSNGPMLTSLFERDGGSCEVVYCEDRAELIESHLAATDVDVVLVSGGSSVGKEDFAPSIVAQAGELVFHGIAMRPSSPTGIGKIGKRFIFLLPGNPVSCMCAYDFFAGRLIRSMGNREPEWPYRKVTVKLGFKISSMIGRVDYCRVQIREQKVIPIAISGASMLSTLTRADGFVIVERDSEGFDIDQPVDVFLFNGNYF